MRENLNINFITIIMAKKINKFIYWIPRILAILLILFLMIFSLDVFEPELSNNDEIQVIKY